MSATPQAESPNNAWRKQTPGHAGWVPWMIEALDHAHQSHHMWVRPVLPELPSFYYRRNCFSAFMNDRAALLVAEELDLVDNFM